MIFRLQKCDTKTRVPHPLQLLFLIISKDGRIQGGIPTYTLERLFKNDEFAR